MRKLLLIAALFAVACFAPGNAALAAGCGPGNPNCIVTTMPFGDASNRAASDAFVRNAITNLGSIVNSVCALTGAVTAAQVTACLNTFTPTTQGMVPASGGSSTSLFLNQAGGFSSPVAGSNGQVQANVGGVLGGLTNTQLTALINPFSATLPGAVPASGGSSTQLFLNQAGGFSSPTAAANYQPVYNITQSPFNAKCNFGFKSDIAMASGSTTATSASGWQAGDVGKYIIVQGGGPNISTANTVITNATASIATAGGNAFSANQFVTFSTNVGTNIIANTAYYVSATGLSGAAFQISATPGGVVLVPNGGGSPVAVTSANLVTTIATFVNSTTVTLTAGNTSGNIASARIAEYGSDDAAAVSAAIAAANTGGGGTVYIPPGTCLVSQVNFTNVTRGVTLKGEGVSSSVLMPLQVAAYSTTHGHVIDLTGSAQVTLQDFQLGAGGNLPLPATGLFVAQVPSNVANRIRLRGVFITGQYGGSALYDFGVPSWDAITSDFYNYNPGAGNKGAVYLTNNNAFSYTSGFTTVASAGGTSTSDIHFFDCELHKFAGTGADNWVLRLDATTNISFTGGVINGGASSYVFLDNANAHLGFFNVTFENEGPGTITTPTNAFDKITGTVTDLNDPGSSYGNSGAKFNPTATPTNLVTNAF